MSTGLFLFCIFFFNDTATTEIYTLSLHDALPILSRAGGVRRVRPLGHDAFEPTCDSGLEDHPQPSRTVGLLHLGRLDDRVLRNAGHELRPALAIRPRRPILTVHVQEVEPKQLQREIFGVVLHAMLALALDRGLEGKQ